MRQTDKSDNSTRDHIENSAAEITWYATILCESYKCKTNESRRITLQHNIQTLFEYSIERQLRIKDEIAVIFSYFRIYLFRDYIK